MDKSLERELAVRAAAGDDLALARLCQHGYPTAYRFALALTLNAAEAEDVVQEAMLSALTHIASFRPERASFSTWLCALARNIAVDRYRSRVRRIKREERTLLSPRTQDEADRLLERDELLQALSRLPDKLRLPLCMKYGWDMELAEIARRLRIPVGTVKSRLHNGVKALRKELLQDGTSQSEAER